MKLTFVSIAVFWLFLLAYACSPLRIELAPDAYISWVEDPANGILVSKQLNSFGFELQYKPLDYVTLKDNGDPRISSATLSNENTEIGDMQYFTFRISEAKGGDLLRDDVSSVDQFSDRLAYFSSGMQNDVKLIENSDTLSCLLFHFERTYGIDPRSTFTLGFPFAKEDGKGGMPAAYDKIFLYDDHELGTGPVYIKISADKINSIPQLNLH
jgi:hypothetical protein